MDNFKIETKSPLKPVALVHSIAVPSVLLVTVLMAPFMAPFMALARGQSPQNPNNTAQAPSHWLTNTVAQAAGHGDSGHGDSGHSDSGHSDSGHGDSGHGDSGHSDPGHGHHHHAPLEVPVGMPAPTLDLVVHQDPIQGWNLELRVTHFRFAPENVNGPSSVTEGHAHLYINGEKMGRIYGPWHHLPTLPPGHHDIRVDLNANGHEPLFYQGEAIADQAHIIVE